MLLQGSGNLGDCGLLAFGGRAGHVRAAGEFCEGTAELDDLLRRLLREAIQRARSDQSSRMRTRMVAKWVYQTGATGKLETSPLVVDGILYATAQDDRAFALDARTGRPIWMYQRQLPGDIRPCCGRVNRGLAILGDKVFLGTLDAHVIALDAKTGTWCGTWSRRTIAPGTASRWRRWR